jgi:chromosome segregation ATPase
VEGFLSLTDAAEKLGKSPGELAREIAEGKVVAVVKNNRSWISPGEVRRLGRGKERPEESSSPDPVPSNPTTTEPSPRPPQLTEVETAPEKAEAEPLVEEARTSAVDVRGIERQALQDLQKRCDSLSQRVEELENTNRRMKMGLEETEGALRRSRTAKQNLENDVISLTEQLKKAQTRSAALEREVQHLSHELERAEEKYANDMRRFRSSDRGAPDQAVRSEVSSEELNAMRRQMQEKDRIISQEYQERAVLRAQLEEKSQKYFELKARYDKEKGEWSEILARELQTHGQLKSQLEELNTKTNQKGWNPFRRDR